MDHGSEFRPVDQLSRLVGRHPNFPFLKEMFQSGFDYILTRDLTDDERLAELEAQLERGNHKSTTDNEGEIKGCSQATLCTVSSNHSGLALSGC